MKDEKQPEAKNADDIAERDSLFDVHQENVVERDAGLMESMEVSPLDEIEQSLTETLNEAADAASEIADADFSDEAQELDDMLGEMMFSPEEGGETDFRVEEEKVEEEADKDLGNVDQAMESIPGFDVKDLQKAAAEGNDKLVQQLLTLVSQAYGTDISLNELQNNSETLKALENELDSELAALMNEGTSFLGVEGSEVEAPVEEPAAPANELDDLSSELDGELAALMGDGASFVGQDDGASMLDQFEVASGDADTVVPMAAGGVEMSIAPEEPVAPAVTASDAAELGSEVAALEQEFAALSAGDTVPEEVSSQPLDEATSTGAFLIGDLQSLAEEAAAEPVAAPQANTAPPQAEPLDDALSTGTFLISDLQRIIDEPDEDSNAVSGNSAAELESFDDSDIEEALKAFDEPTSGSASAPATLTNAFSTPQAITESLDAQVDQTPTGAFKSVTDSLPLHGEIPTQVIYTAEFGKAPVWYRLTGAIIDVVGLVAVTLITSALLFFPAGGKSQIVGMILAFPMWLLKFLFGASSARALPSADVAALLPHVVGYIGLFLFCWFLYSWLTTWYRGATYGQSFIGLRVLTDENDDLNLGQSLLRTMGQFTCLMTFGIGSLFAFGDDNKTLQDKIASTKVVQE